MTKLLGICLVVTTLISISGCASGPEVKQQAYAKLPDHRTYEYEFPVVWKAIEETLRNYRVINRDPKDVDANEMRRIRHRTLETDWVFTKSTDKYVEYKVNDLPRKIYLQTKLKYKIDVQSVIGGTTVTVVPDEQIEKLNPDGSPAGWDTVEDKDSSRAANMLDKINMSILSAAP